ncbi:hypothetical protein [Streptomyces sp. NPDC059080]|uniref:hypothetical protein n=1 Tax=Streptomyces sp. NPDC059080 TaxID=3346718 RepID=UPI003695346A
MRAHVVYEQDGRIVGLVEIEDRPAGGVGIRPVAEPGREVAEMEIPDRYRDSRFAELLDVLRVDVGSGTPALVER